MLSQDFKPIEAETSNNEEQCTNYMLINGL